MSDQMMYDTFKSNNHILYGEIQFTCVLKLSYIVCCIEKKNSPPICTAVKVRPWKAGNYLKNRSLVDFRIVRMALCIRDNHEMRWARASRLRCHHDSGNNKVASLLRLLGLKVSNRQGLA